MKNKLKNFLLKKLPSLALTAALILPLTACGSTGETQEENTTPSADTSEWVYVPEFLQIENMENISWYDTKIIGDDLYYTSYSWDEETEVYSVSLCRYSLTDKTTEEIPLSLQEDANLSDWVIGEDGSIFTVLYIWNMDEGTSSRMLAKYDAQGNEIYSLDINDIFTDEYSYIQYMEADSQGRVYLVGDSMVRLFDEEGNNAGAVNLSSGGRSYVNNCLRGIDGKVYICAVNYGEMGSTISLTEVNFDTKSLGESYENFPSGSGNSSLAQNPEGKYLINNGSVVSEYDPETQEKQELFSWLDCDINGSYVRSYGVLPDGRLAAVYQDWQTNDSGVALLTRTDSSQVVQKQQIVIATMYSSSDLQAAAVTFNKSSDEYRVTIRSYMNYDNMSETYQDALARLNSDITSNNCPDIIDLSSVDVSQLAAKGVFEDLNPYLEQSTVLNRADLIENVLDAYTYDNVLVSIPDCFMLQTVVGSTALVGEEMGWTLDEMIAFADEHPDAELFDRASKQTILNYCLMYNMDVFVDWNTGTCNFDSEEFKQLLEFVNRFPDWDDITYEQGQDSEPVRIQKGEVLLSNVYLSDLDEMQLYIEMFQGPVTCIGYPNMDGGSGCILTGSNAYAITAKSDMKAGAWAFIESYLTRENVAYRWGYPINRSELNKMAEEATKVEYITDENGELVLDENGDPIAQGVGMGIGYGDWQYNFRVSTKEEVDIILDLIDVAKPMSSSDQQIMEIISEETESFYQGQKTVDEVVAVIQSRAGVYVSENS